MPTCHRCKEYKPPKDFHKDNSRKSKLSYWCKACHQVKQREYRLMSGEHKAMKKNDKRLKEALNNKGYIEKMKKAPDLDASTDLRNKFLRRD